MQILKHWGVISTLHLGHPFYWRPGIKTSSTGKEGCVTGNNWGNIACLKEHATLLREGPESHFIFLPITFSFFSVFFFFSLSVSHWGIEMEHVWQWGRDKNGGRKSTKRWVGLMWPRELPERKMGIERRRGHWWEWGWGGAVSEEDGVRVIYMSEVCVCVCVFYSPHLIPPNMSHPSLSTSRSPLPLFFPPPPPMPPPTPPPLFTLTVIWQAQGWQTWSRQGKRLSGLALLGSCWLAEELAVRSGSCDWPGDWWGGEGELSLQWCDEVG